jgi:cytosine deaminase
MLVRPGTVEPLEQALRMGAEMVGGLDPCAIDRDPKGHVDTVFGLAEKFGRGVDIHLHEPGEMGAFSMELIIERTVVLGMRGKVIVSHAFRLGMPDSTLVDPLIAALAEARIAIMTAASASRTVPSLIRLVQVGGGGVRRIGRHSRHLGTVRQRGHAGARDVLRRDDELTLALDVVTTGGARALGLEGYGLAQGCGGDLVLVEAETVAEAVAQRPGRRTVVKRGRVVASDGVGLP